MGANNKTAAFFQPTLPAENSHAHLWQRWLRQRTALTRDLLFLLALLIPAFTALLGLRPLSVPDEGRYPEVAREMLLTGDFVTPTVNGVAFLDKPALYYWLEAASMHVFGVHEWSIRLPPALFGVLGVVVVFLTARKLFSRRAAWWSAAALATNPLYFLASQYADMNIEIAVFVTCALCCLLMARQHLPGTRSRRRLFMFAWLAIGLGVMTKGLIGAVFPAMVVGVWVVINARWRELRHWYFISGLTLTLAVCLPWFVAVQNANPQFLHYFFVYQQFERFTGGGFNNTLPFWFYVPVVLGGSMPWSLFLPACLRDQWQTMRKGRNPIDADARQLLMLWPLLILIFFSIPESKIVGYILPVLPPLSLLLGDYLARQFPNVVFFPQRVSRKQSGISNVLRWFPMLGALVIVIAIVGAARFDHTGIRPLAQTLKHAMSPTDKLICFRNYYQDLPIYLQLTDPLIVIDNWNDPEIMLEDSWRRDFYLGLTHQASGRNWLLDDKEFARQLEQRLPHQRIFVMARSRDEQTLVNQYGLTVLQRNGKQLLLATSPQGQLRDAQATRLNGDADARPATGSEYAL